MAFSYDEPIRYNEGKVDWTLLPWDKNLMFDLSEEVKNLFSNTKDIDYVNHIYINLFEGNVFKVLCLSLLANGKFSPKSTRVSELPWDALEQVCRVFQHGVEKYSRDNYKIAPGLPLENYIQSMWRHTVSYLKGDENDTDSGLSNLAHLACNAFMYLWTQKTYHEPKTKDTSVQR